MVNPEPFAAFALATAVPMLIPGPIVTPVIANAVGIGLARRG